MRPDPFWLVLQEAGDIGELTLHPGGEDHQLLLEALGLKAELAVDPFQVSLPLADRRQHRRRCSAVLDGDDEVLKLPLELGPLGQPLPVIGASTN